MDGIKVITINLNKERNEIIDSIKIIPISDTHIGDPLLDLKLLKATIEEIKDEPNTYTIINGDILNTALKNSKSDVYRDTMSPDEQIDKAVEYFEEISDKILVYHGGNHERRSMKDSGVDMSRIIAQRLGIEERYAKDMWYLFLSFGKCKRGRPVTYQIAGYHGSAGGRKPGGKANRLKEMSSIMLADLYIMSHAHEKIITDGLIFVPDEQHRILVEKELNYLLTNSFLKYGDYGASGGYNPSNTSTTEAILDGKIKRFVISKVGKR